MTPIRFFKSTLFILILLAELSFSSKASATVAINVIGPIPRDTSYSIASTYRKQKKNYPDIQPASIEITPVMEARYNITYTVLENTAYGRRELKLDIFKPRSNGRYPAVILIHGGGWRSGSKEMEHALAAKLAGRGIVAVAIEYRLSLEARYPAALHDIRKALDWISQHAESLSIDTSRLVIAGNSAGGQLATLIGLQENHKINGIIDIDGVVDFLAPGSLNLPRTAQSADVFWLEGTFEDRPGRWKEASPIFYVDRNSPPIVFITSGQPRFTAGMHEMMNLLKLNNIDFRHHHFENTPHSFWLFEPWFSKMSDCIATDILNFFSE